MLRLPKEIQLLEQFRPVFSAASYQRFLLLCLGAIVTTGRRTVSRILWTLRALTHGHPSSYHRFFSRSPWSLLAAGKVLSGMVLALLEPNEPVVVVVDDTTEPRKGEHVYGKGCHRDAVRSTRAYTVHLFGLKWVVLAVLVRFAFCQRAWALPVLVALYRPPALNQQEHRRHKTPIDLARGLLAVLLRWFPDRRFILLGDGAYASHELAQP